VVSLIPANIPGRLVIQKIAFCIDRLIRRQLGYCNVKLLKEKIK